MRQVILVAGPPCAGKTTYVAGRARPGDRVLDQDVLGAKAMQAALQAVAGMTAGTAWVIRCCAGPKRRAAFAASIRATDTVLLVPDRHTLIDRAAHRPSPRRHIAAVEAWLRAEQADRPPGRPRTPGSTPASDPAGPRSRHRSGRPYRRARAEMLAIYGDRCHLCGHGGATQADHLVPISVWSEQPIDPHLMRPAHGNQAGARCPTCGLACNQARGNRPHLEAAGYTTDDF